MPLNYHQYQANIPIECPHCIWSGKSKETRVEYHGETVAELFCPQCDYTIALVDTAWTEQDLIREEEKGNPEALYLRSVQNRIAKTRLESADKLPDLNGHERLEFIWHVYRENIDPSGMFTDYWSEIKLKDNTFVFKEMAYSCDGKNGRVDLVKKWLKGKYGKRFQSLLVTFQDYDCGCYFED